MKTKRTLVAGLLAASGLCHALLAQVAPKPAPAPNESASPKLTEDVVTLSPFEVSAAKDTGYQATETLAGTRIRTDLKDVASAIQVVTKDFMADVGATDNSTLLQYTTNAEVAGTRGTYAGLGNGTSVDETANLRAPGGAQRVRGLASADTTRDFFVTDIPWDSYNVDRIDIQRGPNSILFGLGSPAGIINASTHTAEFRNKGGVEARFGSYGSVRGSLDLNQVLIDNVLSIRFDGLWSDEKYQQEPAFENNRRYYGAIRFEPKLFKDPSFQTSIKANYEHGEINADRPRITPPIDRITPWFRPVSSDPNNLMGGMGKLVVNNGYDIGSNPLATSPWLAGDGIANQQQPLWFMDGTTDQLYRIYGGYINNGARNVDGSNRGVSGGLLGLRNSPQFFGLTDYNSYATNAKLTNSQYGQYRNMSLLDSSVFDFYNNLIDGPTKNEWEKWDSYNVDVSQTAWDNRLGIDFTYDRQKYERGGQNLLGNPALSIDILRNFQDQPQVTAAQAATNPNFGRPYALAGAGGGNSYESDREVYRGSVFGELRASDFMDKDSFLTKLIGKHRFNGVYSDEKYHTENRSWQMYANSRAWGGLWNQNDGSTSGINDRAPVGIIYLGSSIASQASAAGANIPGITAPVAYPDGGVFYFDSTWKNPTTVVGGVNTNVSYSDPWLAGSAGGPNTYGNAFIDPATGASNPAVLQQNSNPANYVGWNANNFQMNLLRYNNGDNLSLLTKAVKSLRETKSWAGTWQGFFWNDAIVPTLGWRYDQVVSTGATALPVTNNRGILNLNTTGTAASNPYVLPDGPIPTGGPANQTYAEFSDHSTSGGIVVHINKFFGEHDPIPFNVSLTYNKSNNFQVTDARYDIYGHLIANPVGATKDYGILLSTKDGKYSFRAIKYETDVTNGSTPSNLVSLFGDSIRQGLRFRNVFLYKLSGYTWDTREQTNNTPGQRYWWTPAYVTSAGRPVSDLNGSPTPPAGAVLETDAQGVAHRDAVIRAWNDIQKHFEALGYFKFWGYTPTTSSALTDRATYEATLTLNGSSDGKPIPASQYQPDINTVAPYNYPGGGPQGFTVTSDTHSEGYEFELTANPLPNWRVSFNASETTATRTNVGGAVVDDFVAYMDAQMAGIAGDLRQFNGNYVAVNEVRANWNNARGNYTLLKLQENTAASELRKWRYNIVTNYTFITGFMKGTGVGASYRWQDKVVIGYPVIPGTNGQASFDLSQPYYGPSEDALDLWVSYERRITKKINWKVQLNVRNVGKNEGLIPISVEPDGKTWASVRVAPVQEWFVTNTFAF